MARRKGSQAGEGKEQFWRRIVEVQPESGQSVRHWCDRHGVSEPSFYAWRRELAKRDAVRNVPGLLPVTIRSLAAPIEITWPDGVVVRVSSGCDGQLLHQTLQVLRSLEAEAASC
jgi:transposase-like protein